MFETFRNAWKIQDLRKKMLFTLLIVLIFRVGSVITVPYIDVNALKESMSSTSGGMFMSYLSVLTGGAMQNGAVFAMSVTPYINASIIMQLLTVAIPALERLQKEGEEGRKKLAGLTRVAAVILGVMQGTGFYFYLLNSGFVEATGTFAKVFAGIVIVLCFSAGTALLMWMGEQIDSKGVGNGISILLFAGIISRVPQGVVALYQTFMLNGKSKVIVVLTLLLFLGMIAFVVWMTASERRIPVQYAKRVVGRKMYGGQSTHIPIKVNMSGVMPIIFASSILSMPSTILSFMTKKTSLFARLLSMLDYQSAFYAILYFAMIIGFAFFYTTIQYNPIEMANNLRKNSGAIPGIRPGKPTSDFISKILSKITLIGAIFLGVIAILPVVLGAFATIPISIGGTSLLIVVGVVQDTVQQIESQMMMRHYKGFLD